MTNPNTPCDLKKCHDLEQPWTNWRFHHENIGEYHVYNNFIRGYNGGFTVQSSTNGDAAHAQLGFKHVVIICNQRIMDFGSVWNFVAVKSHVFPWKSQVFSIYSQGWQLRPKVRGWGEGDQRARDGGRAALGEDVENGGLTKEKPNSTANMWD